MVFFQSVLLKYASNLRSVKMLVPPLPCIKNSNLKKQNHNHDVNDELTKLEKLQEKLREENAAWKKLLENLARLKNTDKIRLLTSLIFNPKPLTIMHMRTILLTLTLVLGFTSVSMSQNDGSLDPTFGTEGITLLDIENLDIFHHLLVQPDQKIVAAGMTWSNAYVSTATAVRYMPDGTLDATFGNNGIFTYTLDFEANIYRSTLAADGGIILTGSTTNYSNYRLLLIKITSEGVLDAAFGDNGIVLHNFSDVTENSETHSYGVAIDEVGNIIVAGNAHDEVYTPVPMVCRFTPTGQLDETFGNGGVVKIPSATEYSSNFDAVEVLPDGKIIAAGSSGEGLQFWVMLAVRLNTDGTLDENFGTNGIAKYNIGNVDDEIYDIAYNEDGELFFAGFSATQQYTYRSILLKASPDGTLDASFGDNGVVMEVLGNYTVGSDVELLSDGQLLVAGTSGEGPPNAFDLTVWKYNPDGTPDVTFAENGTAVHMIPGRNAFGEAMAIQADGKVLVSGQARLSTEPTSDGYIVRFENSVVTAVSDTRYAQAPAISPNPVQAGSSINLSLKEGPSQASVIEIFDMTGKKVAGLPLQSVSSEIFNHTVSIPAGLSAGLYLVRVRADGFVTSPSRLVIMK